MTPPLEHDYIGLSETANKFTPQGALNLKDTELRLGLPGSELPERVDGEVVGLSLGLPVKNFVSGAKRGFFDAIDGSGEWGLSVVNGSEVEPGKYGGSLAAKGKNASEKHLGGINAGMEDGGTTKAAPPPNLSFMLMHKHIMVTGRKWLVGLLSVVIERIQWLQTLPRTKKMLKGSNAYVKVSMDGAPYLRKVDLKTYSNYHELSLGLEKMFTCFSIGQCGSHVMSNREKLTKGRVMDLLQGSEYVLTYEDKDGDWMLIGDVPWEMFTDSCRKLRIMKGSDAIGIAPKAIEKSRSRN